MTIINRALHKAYQRRAETEPASEHDRPGSASVSGWASKLREPIRPPVGPAAASTSVSLPTTPAANALAAAPGLVEQWSWPPIVQRLLTCPAALELRDLAFQLRDLATGNDLRCVALSGPGRNVGRTSLVLTLASVMIADKSTRVAIVDADFNHPDAAQMISLHPAAGLEEAINSPEPEDGVVTTLLAGRLAIVPLVKPVAALSIDQRRIGTLQTFLRSLRREYDVVLIDAGPWEPAHPPLLECGAVDAVVCIRRASSSRDEPADERNFRLPGVEWLGVVETFADRSGRDNDV